MLLASAKNFVMPPGASTVSPEVDWLMYFVFGVCVVFGLLIFIGTAWLAIRFRHRPGVNDIGRGPTHSNLLEIIWSVIPLIIVLLIGIWGFQGYMSLAVLPPANDADTLEIGVNAYKWAWEFQYPNGYTSPTLHVPVNTKIRLVESSRDVIHSLFLPEFRVKKDVVPGRFNKTWFEATEASPMGLDLATGQPLNPDKTDSYDYDVAKVSDHTASDQDKEKAKSGFDIYCTEYCGTGHSRMLSKVYVHPTAESFKAWLTDASNVYKGDPPAKDVGAKLVKNNGCATCHSVDGTTGTGPTWKDMFGAPVHLSDGKTLTVDENYVRESILYPQKEIVAGFGPAMPSYLGKFSDRDLYAIISYMKSISSNYKGSPDAISAPTPKLSEDKNAAK